MVSNAVGGSISVTAFLKVTETTATPQLKANGGSNGPFDFSILGEPGRLYRIQSSTHLVDWSEERSFPKEFVYHDTSLVRQRNGLVYNNQNVYSVPEASRQNSYRTTDYVPPLAACINNLAVIRFAKEIWALEIKANGNSVPTPGELAPYMDMKNGGPACPLSGSNGNFQVSYTINLLHMNPSCKISLAHLLEEPEF